MFITIEGPDGVGKTTLAKALVEKLITEYNTPALYTSEPTNTNTGLLIRHYLQSGGITKDELLKLFLLDRKEHIEQTIIPYQQKGYIVVSDRYKYSTICYQHLQGFSIEYLVELNNFISPDISFILDLEIHEIQNRINNRNKSREIFENETFIKKSIDLYKKIPDLFPNEKIISLKASKTIPTLVEEMITWIPVNTLE